MKNKITYREITPDELYDYGNIPFYYKTSKKYELRKLNRGLGGIQLELIDVPEYFKDFGSKVDHWKEIFDLSNWKFFVACNENEEMIAGCVVATKTKNCNMLEGKDNLAVLWDIRVNDEYKHNGIGQHLFDMAKDFAINSGFTKLKVECQNTNPAAVNFYHKQGMYLGAINEYAYSDCPNETKLLWYLDL